MATFDIGAYTIAYPTVTDRIRVDIRLQSDETLVASQIKLPPHPIRIWNFPGLDRLNYIFDMNVIDGAGNPIANLAYFDIQPPNLGNAIVRDDEQIFPGVTPGFGYWS